MKYDCWPLVEANRKIEGLFALTKALRWKRQFFKPILVLVVVWPLLTISIVRVTRSAISLLCRRFCVSRILPPQKIVKNCREGEWDRRKKRPQRRLVSDRLISSQIVHRQMPYDKTYSLLPLLLCKKGTRTLTSQFLWILNRRWFHEKDRLRDS